MSFPYVTSSHYVAECFTLVHLNYSCVFEVLKNDVVSPGKNFLQEYIWENLQRYILSFRR